MPCRNHESAGRWVSDCASPGNSLLIHVTIWIVMGSCLLRGATPELLTISIAQAAHLPVQREQVEKGGPPTCELAHAVNFH